jgi:protocatechuate 3,4-dioxygenase beta subunit
MLHQKFTDFCYNPVVMDNDDLPVGRVLTRREALAVLGGLFSAGVLSACAPSATRTPEAVAAAATQPSVGVPEPAPAAPTALEPAPAATTAPVAASTAPETLAPTATFTAAPTAEPLPACVVAPAMTEGPYFVDERMNRSDVRDPGMPGKLLTLNVRVLGVTNGACAPITNSVVDIWHCDAAGVYSDVSGESSGTKFLRGYQVTNDAGRVTFQTIFPGWYPGRAVHIHFKVRSTFADGRTGEFTSQLFFDEAMISAVYSEAPYNARQTGWQRNSRDGIFRNGGTALTLNVVPDGSGLAASFDVGVAA